MNRYRRYFLPLALLLPLTGLGLVWLLAELESDEGSIWDVPISGYDPRDLLRGHYVEFSYDWPAVRQDDIPTWSGSRSSLCIIGASPHIESVSARAGSGAAVLSAADCDSIVKANPWSEEGEDGLLRDRIYIPQEAASDYQTKLRNPKLQGIVRIRVNNSGFITPLTLTFQTRETGALQ